MRRPRIACFVLSFLPVLFMSSVQAQAPSSDAAQVRQVVETYLHGLKFNDIESFKKAFWPDAKLLFVSREAKLGQLTQTDWYKGFGGSAGKEEPGDLRITAVEVTNDAASAKVVEDYPGGNGATTRYTDYLSLLKFDGRWWIVNKIYTMERRRAG